MDNIARMSEKVTHALSTIHQIFVTVVLCFKNASFLFMSLCGVTPSSFQMKVVKSCKIISVLEVMLRLYREFVQEGYLYI